MEAGKAAPALYQTVTVGAPLISINQIQPSYQEPEKEVFEK